MLSLTDMKKHFYIPGTRKSFVPLNYFLPSIWILVWPEVVSVATLTDWFADISCNWSVSARPHLNYFISLTWTPSQCSEFCFVLEHFLINNMTCCEL